MKNKSIAIRLASMLLDHFIMTFGIVITFLIIGGTSHFISKSNQNTEFSDSFTFVMMGIGFLLFSVYFNKDAIKGKSPGKRILGFVIVENKTGKIANPIKSLIRNLTIVLWPIEVIFSIFSPQRRIGDYIAGTKVIEDDQSLETKIKPIQILLALFLGLLFLSSLLMIQLPVIGKNPFEW